MPSLLEKARWAEADKVGSWNPEAGALVTQAPHPRRTGARQSLWHEPRGDSTRHPGGLSTLPGPLPALRWDVPRLLSQRRQVGEAPKSQVCLEMFPGSAVKSDESSALRETPQGWAFALPWADRLQGEGAGQELTTRDHGGYKFT